VGDFSADIVAVYEGSVQVLVENHLEPDRSPSSRASADLPLRDRQHRGERRRGRDPLPWGAPRRHRLVEPQHDRRLRLLRRRDRGDPHRRSCPGPALQRGGHAAARPGGRRCGRYPAPRCRALVGTSSGRYGAGICTCTARALP